MSSRRQPVKKRSRLDPETRRQQLLEAATALVLQQEYLPLSIGELSAKAGVSKALIYAYFPTQHDLFNAVLMAQLEKLVQSAPNATSRKQDFEALVMAYANAYFSHVAREGPVIHIVFRDQYMSRHISRDVARLRDRVTHRLARLGAKKLKLSAKEAVAAFNLILTIPEEAGRLAYRGDMKPDRAQALSNALIASALKGLAPAPK